MKKIKVAILHNIISPHVIPYFELLAKEKDLDVKVFFCSESEGNRIWKSEIGKKFPYAVLPNRKIEFKRKDLFTYYVNPSVISELKKFNPDVVISAGWDLLSYQAAFFYSKIARKKFILWSGSTRYELSWRRTLASPLVRLMVKGSDAYIAYGTRAKEYLIFLGAKPKKIFISWNTTNIEYFRKESENYKKEKKSIKKKLGIKTAKVILYVGQLIERKGVKYLIEAFRKIKKEDKDVSLLIIGYGLLEKELMHLVKRQKISDVIFFGGVKWEETPKYYAIADVLVLPSLEEVWGLVINEAMATGLPVIVTKVAGGSADLIRENENGFVVSPRSSGQIFQTLKRIINDDKKSKMMSEKSSEIIESFTPKIAVNQIYRAIISVAK